jgi:3-carboxy-cis,cis-muconate cycloisomerase
MGPPRAIEPGSGAEPRLIMSIRLVDCLATTDALAEVFSDDRVLGAMLDFEAALARASAQAGVVPAASAAVITDVAARGGFNASDIAAGARSGATPAIPFVKALRARVREMDPASAGYVHAGATSQDVTDTALVLVLRRAQRIIAADHERLEAALRALSEGHAGTVMLGRTLLQPATPTTFGLKVAAWTAPIVRSWRRLERAWTRAMVLQLGGAAGTLAALGDSAPQIAESAARDLGLRPAPPWHTDRDRLGALIAACGLYVTALGKAARDVALLMQAEVQEAAEPGGGSSSMPQKRNPSGCALVLAATARTPGLVASYLTAMTQEQERGLGGIQAEWPIVSATVQSTGAAVAALASVIEGLAVDPARMRANLDATRGTIFAERAVLLLAPSLGRDRAEQLVAEAITASRRSDVPFVVALKSAAGAENAVPSGVLDGIDEPARYLGSAERFRTELLGQSDE